MLIGFSESAENIDRTADLLDLGLWVPSRQALDVLSYYQTVFLRLPDAGGLLFWLDQLEAGISLAQLGEQFVGAPEFDQRYGALSNRDFVELLYVNSLGREGDAGGIDFWTSALETGDRTRGGVVEGFAFSQEMAVRLSPYAADGIAFA